jgi:hypothetical protein
MTLYYDLAGITIYHGDARDNGRRGLHVFGSEWSHPSGKEVDANQRPHPAPYSAKLNVPCGIKEPM